MGGFNWLASLVGVASLLVSVQCGCNGVDGVNGSPGRDGLLGAKGQKGEPAANAENVLEPVTLLGLRGDIGSRGQQGPMGPKGLQGDPGAAGQHGRRGPPGPNGKNTGGGGGGAQNSQQTHSAFTAIRTENSYPQFKQRITYQNVTINNNDDFDQNTGEFTCKTSGFYYFNFQSQAKVSMCLKIFSTALDKPLAFCDYSKNVDQVFSGGVVLELAVGKKVWLESFQREQTTAETRDTRDKRITFKGFLLF